MHLIQFTIIAITAFTLASCQTTGSTAGGVRPYTKDVCIVSANKLGSMGDPVTLNHERQEVKFCCQPCVAKFEANPQKYLSQL
jgi:hypothetical protein